MQQAVLDPALAGRDLRITSQTGSGKTLAIGFALRELAASSAARSAQTGGGRGRARWSSRRRASSRARSQSRAALAVRATAQARVVVGHRRRRATATSAARSRARPGASSSARRAGCSITCSAARSTRARSAAVVLDEADRMLDLGFREDLDAILAQVPPARRTHLVSATFPRDVRALADRVQRDPAHVEGTRLGAANVDIDHVLHVVDPRQKLDAIVNLLLADPEAQTLVFARTRADVAAARAGARGGGLRGDRALRRARPARAQPRARRRSSAATSSVLVATDVAARGIDVQDIARVIHAEPPTSADAYTHRSGRTGRAGRKGTSSLLVAPRGVVPATRLLRARRRSRTASSRSRARSRSAQAADERAFAELSRDEAGGRRRRRRSARSALARAAAGRGAEAERVVARLLVARARRRRRAARGARAGSAARPRERGRGDRDRGPRAGGAPGGDRRAPLRATARAAIATRIATVGRARGHGRPTADPRTTYRSASSGAAATAPIPAGCSLSLAAAARSTAPMWAPSAWRPNIRSWRSPARSQTRSRPRRRARTAAIATCRSARCVRRAAARRSGASSEAAQLVGHGRRPVEFLVVQWGMA